MRRIKLVLAVAAVIVVTLVVVSGSAVAQSIPIDSADCEGFEGANYCAGFVIGLIGGTQPVSSRGPCDRGGECGRSCSG